MLDYGLIWIMLAWTVALMETVKTAWTILHTLDAITKQRTAPVCYSNMTVGFGLLLLMLFEVQY